MGRVCYQRELKIEVDVRIMETNTKKSSFSYEDLIECGHSRLFGEGNAQLPLPPMLMFDRVTRINEDGGENGKGEMIAEFDIKPDLWFFDCHFENNPVMPGCLGLDALWQMVGFYLGWTGAQGAGFALGVGEVRFRGKIVPTTKLVTYHVTFKRVVNRRLVLGIADGIVRADGEDIFEAKDLRVGLSTA